MERSLRPTEGTSRPRIPPGVGDSTDGSSGTTLGSHSGHLRHKMRKGTKSCYECRRRKIRCTYAPERPNLCNECKARGSTCIDQESVPIGLGGLGTQAGDQNYSLRERVALLESTVTTILKRLDEMTMNMAISSVGWTDSGSSAEQAGKLSEIRFGLNQPGVSETSNEWPPAEYSTVDHLRQSSRVPSIVSSESSWSPEYYLGPPSEGPVFEHNSSTYF